ncbi:MAG: EAL domain-containing protein [Synergistaceae bacterium]|nr:EAL domain-containing protein [Synergistaceae bacterium]
MLTTWENLEENIETAQRALHNLHRAARLRLRAGIYFPSEGDSVSAACDRAKMACDSIRRNHCVRFRVYEEGLSRSQQYAKHIVDFLDSAMEHGHIRVLYQPIVRVLTGKICGTEALTRWVDPQHGLIRTSEVISTLEQYRDIHKLDLFALRQVCTEYRARRDRGEPLLPSSINLSRLDFELCDIFGEVERIVAENGVPKNMLKIEITESVHGDDPDTLNLGIEKFRQNGYEVWMDDFGSGYSSLGVLKDYSFDTIKFDMKFLSDLGHSEKSRFILDSNLSMAKQLGIQSLAEGVETEEQLTYLRNTGFEKAQGYLFGKAMPLDDIFALPRPREDPRDMEYYDQLSRVELQNQSPMDRGAWDSIARVQGVALFELCEGHISLLAENDVYRQWLGVEDSLSAARGVDWLLNRDCPLRHRALSLVKTIRGREDKTGSFYVFARGNCVRVRVTLIASNPRTGAEAFLARQSDVTNLPPKEDNMQLKRYLEKSLGDIVDLSGEIP